MIIATYKKNRQTIKYAYPWSFSVQRVLGGIFSLLLPVFLYYFVFKKEMSTSFFNYSGGEGYITYVVIGAALNVMSFSTLMNVGRCMITEIREGTLDVFLLSPASRMGYFVGSYLEQLNRSFLESAIILIFGIFLGVRIPFRNIPILFVLAIFISLAFFSVSILVSTLMVYTRDTYLIQNTINLLMFFACGIVFPLSYLPKPIQYLAELFPLTPAVYLFRNFSQRDYSFDGVLPKVFQIIVLSILYLLVGYKTFRRREKKIIEDVLM